MINGLHGLLTSAWLHHGPNGPNGLPISIITREGRKLERSGNNSVKSVRSVKGTEAQACDDHKSPERRRGYCAHCKAWRAGVRCGWLYVLCEHCGRALMRQPPKDKAR